MAEYDGKIAIKLIFDNKDVSSQMSKLENQIAKAGDKVATLNKNLEELGSKKIPTEEYAEIVDQIDKANHKLNLLKERMDKWKALGRSVDSTSFKSMQMEAEQLAKTIKYAKGEKLELEKSGNAYIDSKSTAEYKKIAKQAQYAAAEVQTLVRKHEELAEKERKVGNEAQKAGEKGRSGIRKIIDTCKEGVVSLGQLHKKTKSAGRGFSGMAENVKRFARQFGVMMLMMAGMKLVYAAIDQTKQGIEKLAKQSAPLAANISRMNQALAMLRNSLGTAFAPLINAVVPYLVIFCNWITSAINKVNQFLAALTGKSTWTKAITASTEVADSMNATADAAQKAKIAVQGFHRVNNISSGGTGKGSGGGTEGKDTYEEIQINSNIKNLADEIKSAIAEGDWEGLGEFVGDKVKDALESVDWNKAYAGAIIFGTGLALFLNGLISPELFGDVGSTIASALNTAIASALAFGENFDFENLGESIAEGINDFLMTFDWNNADAGAIAFGTGLALFLNGLISPELFGDVGSTIASALNTAIASALAFGENFDFENFGESIAECINDFFITFDFEAFAETLNTWVDGIEETIGTALKNISWEDVKEGIKEFIGTLELDTVAVIIGTLILKGVGKITIGTVIASWIKKKFVKMITGLGIGKMSIPELIISIAKLLPRFAGSPFDYFASEIFAKIDLAITKLLPSWASEMIGKFVAGFSVAGVASGGNPIAAAIGGLFASCPLDINWFGEGGVFSFEWAGEWFEKALEAFKTAFDGKRADILDIGGWILEGILDGFVGGFIGVAETVAKFFSEIVNGIASVFGIHSPAKKMKPLGKYILLGIIEGFTGAEGEFTKAVKQWFKEGVKPWFTLEKWGTIGNGIKGGIKQKWEDFTEWFSQHGVSKWFNEHVKPKFSKEKWTFSGISNGLKQAFQNAIVAIKQKWNSFATWLNEKLTFKWDDKKIGGKTIISAGSLTLGKIPTFANGGYPNQGDLFIANERGPELVGTINGRAAVGSGKEITGISKTIEMTSNRQIVLLQKQNQILYEILNKQFGITQGDIFQSVIESDKQFVNQTGHSAFGY